MFFMRNSILKEIASNIKESASYNRAINERLAKLSDIDKELAHINGNLNRLNELCRQMLTCQRENKMVRPCVYFGKDREYSVILHSLNGDIATIEYSNGWVENVPINNIQILDSEAVLKNFNRVNNIYSLERYYRNEECFKKEHEQLIKENPDMFDK